MFAWGSLRPHLHPWTDPPRARLHFFSRISPTTSLAHPLCRLPSRIVTACPAGSLSHGGGYDVNGTLPFFDGAGADIWDTEASFFPGINPTVVPAPATVYTGQDTSAGNKQAQFRNSVFFNIADLGQPLRR